MTQSNLDRHQFAGNLPPVLVLNADLPPIPCGAIAPGFGISTPIPDRRILMHQVWYTTPKRIHGLFHYDGPTQLFFVGYECQECHEVFLVPDSVEQDEVNLAAAVRHGCMGAPSTSKFDTRTRVLHIVQDIGRPGNLGSVGCEQYADAIMDVFGESR
jgi:hypothetical protein